MRQLRQVLQAIPQLLLVQPEQLSYDLAYALGLTPLVLAGLIFFRQDAILIFATSFLTGVVSLLALQLARLTLNLPAWVGHKATHPLVASFLIACFFSPHAPLWLAAAAVALFVLLDTVIWPQLQRVMLHPGLIVFGLLFIVQRQIGTYFVNPFDGRRLGDPLTLWYHSAAHLNTIDPVKVYVGNVPGPVGATSAVAILVGLTYLWYAKKVSLGIIVGFLTGIAVPAAILGSDIAFQLSSGPALFLAGYIAADRRRVAMPERFTFVFGLAAGALTMLLRAYGQGQEAAWQSLLVMSAVVTVYLRVRGLLMGASQRSGGSGRFRTMPLASGNNEPRPSPGPARRQEVRRPMMAMAPSGTAFARAARPSGGFDTALNQDDLVRQMRSAASRGTLRNAGANRLLLGLSLVLVNPVGLWLTWSAASLAGNTKRALTAVSVLWYLAAAGLVFAMAHIR